MSIDCVGLPSDIHLRYVLKSFVNADRKKDSDIKNGSFYICLAQGTSDGTYSKLSVITTFDTDHTSSKETRQFEMQCSSNKWSSVSGSFITPGALPAISIGQRKDCPNCTRTSPNENHCLREVQPVARRGNLLRNKMKFVYSFSLCSLQCCL